MAERPRVFRYFIFAIVLVGDDELLFGERPRHILDGRGIVGVVTRHGLGLVGTAGSNVVEAIGLVEREVEHQILVGFTSCG